MLRIDLSSEAVQRDLKAIARTGKLHTLSIRLQELGNDLMQLDLKIPLSTTEVASSEDPPVQQRDQRLINDYIVVQSASDREPVYQVASYTKIVINLLMLLVVKRKKGVDMDKNACVVYNEYRKSLQPTLPTVNLPKNPTIRELLTHINGFPPMNEVLFAADGACVLSIEEFLQTANQEALEYYNQVENLQDNAVFQYSNANHIFAALIIVLMTGMSIHQAAYEYIFKPLEMHHSTLGPNTPRKVVDVEEVIPGFQVSSSDERFPLLRDDQLQDSIANPSMGMRSTPDDIAKFNHALISSLQGEESSFISMAHAHEFFSGEGQLSLAGLIARVWLDKPTLEDFISESPNTYLNQETHQYRSLSNSGISKHNRFHKTEKVRQNHKSLTAKVAGTGSTMHIDIVHKSGYFDGYSCAVFVIPRRRTFLTVMGNTTGPLDAIHYISWYLLQELVGVDTNINVPTEAIDAHRLCAQALAGLEAENLVGSQQAVTESDLVGIYQRENGGQRLTISPNGHVYFHGNTVPQLGPDGDAFFPGASKRSSAMRMTRPTDNSFKVLLDQRFLTLEGWSSWADMNFKIQQIGGVPILVRTAQINGKLYRYKYNRIIDWTKVGAVASESSKMGFIRNT